ncbi:MAG: hypothetical protein M1827_005481 [Pycnora praestabilis]|nr:MAG: hypothetical protein M1827_005481 [Pycnora praestabilis]
MPSFFSKVFKGRESNATSPKSKKKGLQEIGDIPAPQRPQWEDAWLRQEVDPEEVQELLRECTQELKSKALETPFLLLPFRPTSDPSAARTFIRNFFNAGSERAGKMRGQQLRQELRLTEPMVLCSVMKWCWSRLPGGVVSWEAYELFRIGEQAEWNPLPTHEKDSNLARDAFATFIPISVASDARSNIIFDFFDLLAAVAAYGKTNGLGGRNLSRLAGWWAFEHSDSGNGFDGGYRSWARAADATSHLFFAYLRSLSPDSVRGTNGVSTLPISLQKLVEATEYPPETPSSTLSRTTKVVMIVNSVSPTPFALLRRAKNFEYRDEDRALQQFADYEDPVQALTEECRRVLKCISSTNQSTVSSNKASTGLGDTSWSRFQDVGFSGMMDDSDNDGEAEDSAFPKYRRARQGLRTTSHSKTQNYGRPTTPSWADFLSVGFVDEPGNRWPAPLHLPSDQVLPPINTSRVNSPQTQKRQAENDLEPGELASINRLDLDDSFWWVWITSLAGEEPTERKAVFGRCALIETNITNGNWLVFEEKVQGTEPEPDLGAYVVEKKSRFGLTKRGRKSRGQSLAKKDHIAPQEDFYNRATQISPMSKTSIGPDQHARIQAAAAALQQKQRQQDFQHTGLRRARTDDAMSNKTNSVFTLQPVIMSEAAPAMQWANKFDKDAIRAAYLGNNFAGKGQSSETLEMNIPKTNGASHNNTTSNLPQNVSSAERDLPALPQEKSYELLRRPTRSPSPPPLPAMPSIEAEPGNEAAAKAAEVPLPNATPLEKEYLPPTDQAHIHPAQRSYAPVAPQPTLAQQAAKSAWSSANSTPEKSANSKRLQKQNNGTGFSRLFGKKKSENPKVPAPLDSQEVQPGLKAPQHSKLGGRMSYIRNKSEPQSTQASTEPVQKVEDPPVNSTVDDTPIASPITDTTPHPCRESQQSFSRVDSIEQHDADKAFKSFDQGPLDDVPAFVPEASSERGVSPEFFTPAEPETIQAPLENGFHTRAAAMLFNPNRAIEPDFDNEEIEQQPEELTREMSAPQDRWAQIRKNAAERAARQSEDYSRQSQSAKTDDGETTEEETIESRVARIKARVAELTGNMDGQNTVRR